MFKEKCFYCDNIVELDEELKIEYCCSGYMCGCMGSPEPLICDECMDSVQK